MTECDDDRWLVIEGRRWRRTDPELPADIVAALKSHLGRGRSAARIAKKNDDPDATSHARRRVNLAKQGLGERGEPWWEMTTDARLARARDALGQLEDLERG